MFTFFYQRNRGFSFVEVVIALVLAAMVSLTLYGSSIYTLRQTAKNVEQIYGTQMASSAAAQVRAARYAKLTSAASSIGNGEFEKRFFNTPAAVKMDPLNAKSTTYTVTYSLSGYGRGATVLAATSGYPTIDMTLPNGSAHWKANQYAGHFLVVTGGAGANQLMYIKSNEASRTVGSNRVVKVVLTQNLTGNTAVDWSVAPGASSVFAVDYGLYCNVVVTWGTGTGLQTVQETVYVPAA